MQSENEKSKAGVSPKNKVLMKVGENKTLTEMTEFRIVPKNPPPCIGDTKQK